ncbi:Nuclear pore complex protein Nup88 [Habropoda laboriosa]|uniref:Nuclear pore complex protein Nup88 n=1 Tax=Habropoda laboriosa TaxID=597456 RepID=A0A0L7R3E1_9HYME|nr:PREDICTED: nuclear pore complex protein Nup88 [Habropoda laboriosa]KOC65343.1 Nuclear pore complex protein Nup88 [Habropoda laboriosa]
MCSYTDPLRLNENHLFRELKNSLPKNIKDTRNILEIRDNVLYVWNAMDFCVMTSNVAITRGVDVPYQKLRPIDPPIFEIKNILINETGTQLALWGNVGLVFMELPKRWGKDGLFQGGKEEILCVVYNETVEIRKARWHPGSTNDSHLLVLTPENTFRLYECELGDKPKVVKCWKVGRVPFSSPSKIPDFSSLGDTAVDFDFATPALRNPEMFASRNVNKNNVVDWNQIEWPILVLRGNGEVLIVRGNVLHGDSPVVSGALSMYPSAEDNYGIDSCSIMCLQTTPPIVVIAMCTGKIYHAILLKEELADNDDGGDNDKKTWYGSTYNFHTPEEALYVYECVEIELGLFFTDNDEKYNCPIHLCSDKGNKSRYFCSHNAGIHMITLPMMSQLEEYINAPEENDDARLPVLSIQSSSQYLICRRIKHTEMNEATPILGIGLLQEPCILIALLHNGNVVARSVIDLYYVPKIEPPEPIIDKKEKVDKENFDMYIKKLLKHETSQPIIKIGSKSVSSRECLQLLYHATDIFRKEHFAKHDTVREEIGKKMRALKVMKTHLLKELDTLMETKKELHQNAERLAERYEDIKDEQEKLAQRAKEVLRLVNYKEPSMTPIERAEAEELKKMEIKIEEMKIKLLELKKKSEHQTGHIENNECSEKKTEIVFRKDQEKTIKTSLGHIANDMKELIAKIKKLEEEVSI